MMEVKSTKLILHDAIECLIAAIEAKDFYTKGHSTRVADMVMALGKKIGLENEELETIHIAAHLHDIGKIGIPDQILNKEGKLTEEEFETIKRHPQIGFEILSKSKELEEISKIILYHHERWDGKGYPKSLKGEDIPLGARIIAICDAIDAMASERSYRKPLGYKEILEEIDKNSGSQFDPYIVQQLDFHSLFQIVQESSNKSMDNSMAS